MGSLLWFAVGGCAGILTGLILVGWLILRGRKQNSEQRNTSGENSQLIELGQLAGGLAHEIKNPLSTINVNIKLLIEDLQKQDDPESRRLLRRLKNVQTESDRLKNILNDFLRYTGKHELDVAKVDLREAISQIIDFFAPQTDAAGVTMRPMLPDYPVEVMVDVGLFKQALFNLMINAVEAMSDGGELLVKLDKQDQSAIVEVIDTGCGMNAEQLDKLFQAYYSTKSGGSGLGLPTTRRIINEHGGSIHAESEEGRGTRFVVELPLAVQKAESE